MGGARLRDLRQQAHRTQLWVEADADLGTGYLQRVESGKIAQPEPATLERILDALDATYDQRREVLRLYGYGIPAPPPTAEDAARAVAACRRELDEAALPAYLLDFTPRLIAWNRFVPLLFEVSEARLRALTCRSFLAAWFDPASPLAARLAEPDRFLPALVRTYRVEMRQLGFEPELADLQALPLFRRHWAAVGQESPQVSAGRLRVPVRLRARDGAVLQFRISSEPLARDGRFRLIYYIPADPATIGLCAAWALSEPAHGGCGGPRCPARPTTMPAPTTDGASPPARSRG